MKLLSMKENTVVGEHKGCGQYNIKVSIQLNVKYLKYFHTKSWKDDTVLCGFHISME